MSHYVVTGGAGFIGSAIVRKLLAEGASRVVVIDNLLTGQERNIEEIRSRIDFQRADIRNYEEIAPLIRGAAVVFHEAAIPSVPRSIDDPVPSHDVNANGTFNVLRAAKEGQAGTRGLCRLQLGLRRYRRAPQSGEHDSAAEIALRAAETGGRILRQHLLRRVRPGDGIAALLQRVRSAAGSLERLFRRALALHDVGAGPQSAEHLRRWRAIARLHLRGRRGGAQSEGGARQGRRRQHVQRAATAAGSRSIRRGRCCRNWKASPFPPVYGPPRAGDVRDSQADTTLAVRDLGHAPRYSFEEGMRLTLDWYRKTGDTLRRRNAWNSDSA